MKFSQTPLHGAFIIEPELIEDERGFFSRAFYQEEFRKHNLNANIAQCNISFNAKKGTLRGMHYQDEPHDEAKLVRCTRGSVFDVIIDLRPRSSSFKNWFSVVLSSWNRIMLYIPEGVAHGFQTLEDDTEVFYQMSEVYYPDFARGVRWNDPVFGIKWPSVNKRIISERDKSYPDFTV